jgi:hypothetical protein
MSDSMNTSETAANEESGGPPSDFDGDLARDMILDGRAPPMTWRPWIKELDIAGCEIKDLSPLAGLSALEQLVLNDTPVSDLAPLAGLTMLRWLWLDSTQVSDLSPLAGLIALESLYLRNTPVSDLSPLAGLSALEQLVLNDTQVSDLSPLAGLTALESLYLRNTPVSDLSPLANLAALRWLDLDDAQASSPIMTSETAANEEMGGPPSDLDGDLAREMSLERTETPVLTLEAIEADAWNAVAYELPEKADRALLDAAFRAVRSCVARERELMLGAEEGLHVPAGRTEGEDSVPVHAYNEARWRQARERLDLIGNRYLQELHAYNEAHRIDWDTVR